MPWMFSPHRLGSTRVLDCPVGAEYDEQTFRYFLGIEHARAARANRSLALLLAGLETLPDTPMPMSTAAATTVFRGLRAALRDTDVIGWYRQDLVAGVVLGASASSLGGDLSAFERRIELGLRRRLPLSLASTLRVRVAQWPLDGVNGRRES
jgi:hypothetical protein